MNITARKISGSLYTPEDILEIKFDGDSKTLEHMYYSLEVVSGPSVTHGGGGLAGDYLHYQSYDNLDKDGDFDYSTCEMVVSQMVKGVSTIKIKGKYLTKLQRLAYIAAFEAWEDKAYAVVSSEAIDLSNQPNVDDYTVVIETGNIILDWSDDVFV